MTSASERIDEAVALIVREWGTIRVACSLAKLNEGYLGMITAIQEGLNEELRHSERMLAEELAAAGSEEGGWGEERLQAGNSATEALRERIDTLDTAVERAGAVYDVLMGEAQAVKP